MKTTLSDWKMNYRSYRGVSCTVPCSMYSVMLENGYMEDPFWGVNEREALKMSDYPCEFVCSFDADESEIKKDYVLLNFFGVDTIAEIRLNGKIIGKTKNMHLKYSFDVKNIILPGKNELSVSISSPTEYYRKMTNKHENFSSLEPVQGFSHLRKALSMSGWDWGPQLPDMGIFRPVELECYDFGKLDDFFVCQQHGDSAVDLNVNVEAHGSFDDIFVTVDGKKVRTEDMSADIRIENPELWWPNGYGKQKLYDIKIEMVKDGKVIDTIEKKIGLRTIDVSTVDKNGKKGEFCFVVNGVRIFAMGGNYIPEDSIYPRINNEKIRSILNAAMDAHYNCIRVWGGGYYPSDEFYDMCDELGLIIWQDFMAACCEIRLSKEMTELVKAEAIYNLKRFRNHASFGLFCGNNENEGAVADGWGGKTELRFMEYLELFERILPDISEEYAPQTFYWPSSPSSGGGLVDPWNYEIHDAHVWEIWGDGLPSETYRKYLVPFCSEYGFQSYPSMKTLKTVCSDEDMNLFSEVIENHQKSPNQNMKLLTFMNREFLYQTEFEKLVYATQVMQADSIRIAVEHFRRNRGKCMGSLYWQINDCWPVASWSSLDYYGRYKPLHYSAKRFYAPLLMIITDSEEDYTVSVSNEQMTGAKGTVKYGVYDNSFNEICVKTCEYSVNKLSAKDIAVFDASEYAGRRDVFFAAECYDESGRLISSRVQLFVKPKFYSWQQPEIKLSFEDAKDGVKIAVSAKHMAKSVFIDFDAHDVILSDNNFDIMSDKEIVLFAKTDISAKELEKTVNIKTMCELCR